jgi:predicted N-acetyltransferase YhbS
MSDLLEQLFELYRQSFPANECRTEADLRAALATQVYRLLTKVEAGNLLGFAILFVPAMDNFALLEYLAVHPARRNEGIGGQLVRSAIEETRGRSLFVEIDSKSDDPVSSRRQSFYSRYGFRIVEGVKYQLPLPGSPPMELWACPHADSIQSSELARWLTTIYVDVYHCSKDDPRIAQMLGYCT